MNRILSTPSCAGLLPAFLLLLAALPAAAVEIASKPLILPTPQPPNVVLTVEEYISMMYGIPPYEIPNIDIVNPKPSDYKRYHYSSHYNTLYYNPSITYKVPKKPDGTPYTTSFTAALENGYDADSGTVNLGKDYRPTLSYHAPSRKQSHGSHPHIDVGPGKGKLFAKKDSKVHAYYYRFNEGSGCHRVHDKKEESCYSRVWVGEHEQQNFANWYSFYRTRYLAVITALHLAMPKLEGKIRLAWQGTGRIASFNISTLKRDNCVGFTGDSCAGWDGTIVDNRLKPFTGTHRDNFYKWLTRLGSLYIPFPTIRLATTRVGDYLSIRGNYCDDPTSAESAANPARACRDNVHIIVTDGEHFDWLPPHTIDLPAGGDIDSTSFALGESDFAIAYTPRPPYMDYPLNPKPGEKSTHTMADLAFYYWARDLVPGLDNSILPYLPDQKGTHEAIIWNPRNNPATWQHIVTYVVTSGMSAVLAEDWNTNTYDGKQAKGEKNWPSLALIKFGESNVVEAQKSRIYDYWHAALNSRGQFYDADETDRLVQALENVADRIEKRLAASAAIAANSTRLDTGTVVYQARYTAVDWTGELIASKLTPDGAVGETLWTASIPVAGERTLVTHDGSKAVLFDSTSLLPPDSDWKAQVNVKEPTPEEVLAWLRGDQSKEQSFDSNGVLTGGKYRRRASLLGDIVNSDPVYVGHQHYGYAGGGSGLPEAGSNAYENFVKANKKRVKMLYVGANDGMLHGFVAGSGSGAGNECGSALGRELFAYIPRAARLKLPTLANPTYGQPGGVGHRYYVDGPPAVGDAYLGDAWIDGAYLGGAWKTVLLGTTGAGGRTIFALDVTNPCDFGPGKVLWERDETWDADLGFTLAKPIIARLNNGQWAAVFGNGYNSGSGKAVLFLVDLATGALIKKFDVGGKDNGLAAPSLHDANGDGTTDFIYAGDLSGRLWKFDVSGATVGHWKVAYGAESSPQPLFTAINASGQAQPITAAPELGVPPKGMSGVMVYFGTGRFFAVGDEVDLKVQSLYGLLDSGTPIGGRSQLERQNITAEKSVGEKKVREASTNAVDYSTKRGWYLDLDHGGAKGERVISTPRRVFNRVFYTTLVPSADPCKFGGTSWLMELDPYSGGMPATSVIDLGGEVAAGVMSTVGIVKSFEFISGERTVAIGMGSQGTPGTTPMQPLVVSPRTGRISWREIID